MSGETYNGFAEEKAPPKKSAVIKSVPVGLAHLVAFRTSNSDDIFRKDEP